MLSAAVRAGYPHTLGGCFRSRWGGGFGTPSGGDGPEKPSDGVCRVPTPLLVPMSLRIAGVFVPFWHPPSRVVFLWCPATLTGRSMGPDAPHRGLPAPALRAAPGGRTEAERGGPASLRGGEGQQHQGHRPGEALPPGSEGPGNGVTPASFFCVVEGKNPCKSVHFGALIDILHGMQRATGRESGKGADRART